MSSNGLDVERESGSALALVGEASEGNVAVDFDEFDVFIAFNKDSDEAKHYADGLAGLGMAFGGQDVGDAVRRKGNVVLWQNIEQPDEGAFEEVEDCLAER